MRRRSSPRADREFSELTSLNGAGCFPRRFVLREGVIAKKWLPVFRQDDAQKSRATTID
jgi:hypothetical protein